MPYGTADARVLGGVAVAAKAGPPRIPAHGTDWVPVVRAGDGGVKDLPLHALISQALVAFMVDFESVVHFPMGMAAGLRRTLPDGAVPFADVPRVLEVNGSGKSALERHGVVRVTGRGDRRVVTLTESARRLANAYDGILADVTAHWRERYGGGVVDSLAAVLSQVDEQVGIGLPDYVIVRYSNARGSDARGFSDVSLSLEVK